MKNFFKKLSFVLAIAMVLTSLTPATASAAAKNYVKNQNGKTVTTQYVYMGGKTVTLTPYLNGKVAKSGVTITSSKKTIATVNKKGEIKPLKNGTTVVTFKSGKTTIGKVSVKVRTRAKSLNIYDKAEYKAGNKTKLTEVTLKAGEKKDLQITMPMYKSAVNAGAVRASYFTYAEVEGSAVKVTKGSTQRAFTLEAVEAGTAKVTIVANQTTQKNVRKNDYYVEASFNVKVTDENGIAEVKANKVNEIGIKFAGAVDKDTVVTVTKKGSAVDGKNAFNADFTEATFTTTAKMTEGTYKVSVSGASIKAEAEFTVETQRVDKIEILNDTALLGEDSKEAYVYYKVLDQYGEDLTASTSLQWTASCTVSKKDLSLGRLTIKKNDGKEFMFNEQVYVTAVYSKTGLAVNKTLTIGQKQSLDAVEMKGFVLKNTSEILDKLPNGFKSDAYYLVYDAVDQNGNVLEADQYNTDEYVTFLSDNIMVVKEIKFVATKTIVIDGHTYRAVLVNPGDFVDKGGDFTVTAIANKTGKTTKKNFVVGQNHILSSFTMEAPAFIADGESVEIKFTALDTEGNEIRNFVALAENLNKLQFSVSEGTLKLEEKDDATAKLTYNDTTEAAKGWNSGSTDGVDRKVNLTAVVIGGKSESIIFDIADKARPEAIKSVRSFDNVLVEEGSDNNTGYVYLDQYGREIPWYVGYDNGFFNAASGGALTGTDFSGYRFSVEAEYKGSTHVGIAVTTGAAVNYQAIVTATADNTVASVNSGNYVEFKIVKTKISTGEVENVSPVFKHEITVVDVAQLKNFAISGLDDKQFVETGLSYVATAAQGGVDATMYGDFINSYNDGTHGLINANVPAEYQSEVKVVGYYGSTKVTLPEQYFKACEANYLTLVTGASIVKVDSFTSGNVTLDHFYNFKTAQLERKDLADTLKVTIQNLLGDAINFASKAITISDAAPYLATNKMPEKLTVNPVGTEVVIDKWIADLDGASFPYSVEEGLHDSYTCAFLDQYGISMDGAPVDVKYSVTNVVESDRYVVGNFKVNSNGQNNARIEGAELGDTFDLKVSATVGTVTVEKTIKVTVGADKMANITNQTNNYTDYDRTNAAATLVDVLDTQRIATLQ